MTMLEAPILTETVSLYDEQSATSFRTATPEKECLATTPICSLEDIQNAIRRAQQEFEGRTGLPHELMCMRVREGAPENCLHLEGGDKEAYIFGRDADGKRRVLIYDKHGMWQP